MATLNDFVEIPISDDILRISAWIAAHRVLYEYPGHAPDAEFDHNHKINIQKGTIAELTTFKYFHNFLENKFGRLDYRERWRAVQDRLCLMNHVGCFDKGSDLTIKKQTVDIKVYNPPLTKERMLRYNLFIGVRETSDTIPPADVYIQAFYTPQNTLVLAGYHEGLPEPIKYDIPTPAHFCPVRDLKPISELVRLLLL